MTNQTDRGLDQHGDDQHRRGDVDVRQQVRHEERKYGQKVEQQLHRWGGCRRGGAGRGRV